MWKGIAANGLTFLILLGIALAVAVSWGQGQYRAEGPLSAPICLRVPSGGTMAAVSRDLEERGAVSSARVFRIGADYEGKAGQLKAGAFLVPAGASMEQIVDAVTRGGQSTCGTEIVYRIGVTGQEIAVRDLNPESQNYEVKVAFDPLADARPEDYESALAEGDARFRIALAEGVTSWQVVNALQGADFLTGEVADLPAEGSLAPDSFEITAGADRAELIAQMQTAQEAILAEMWEARAEDIAVETPEEALILASIIEKETGIAEERDTIAGVFTNRLAQGMKLQTDPTVIYGITRGEGTLGRGLRRSELRRETPWNTYVIDGLPPTPIANPGRAAIQAALNPEQTPFIFFVADGSGGHVFAETLAEHNANVARWREIEAERSDN